MDFSNLGEFSFEVTTTFGVLLVTFILYHFLLKRGASLTHIPIWGEELGSYEKRLAKYTADGLFVFQDGYKKFRKGAFQIATAQGPRIIVGPEATEELRRQPDNVVDGIAAISDIAMAPYTKFVFPDEFVLHCLRTDMNPKLDSISTVIAEEIERFISTEMPPCKDWTPQNAMSTVLRLVALGATRIFAGHDLCHNEDWLKIGMAYPHKVFAAAEAVKVCNPWLRQFFYRSLPQVRELFELRETAYQLLRPVMRARREAMRNPGYAKPNDMLQWMIDARSQKSRKSDESEIEQLAQQQLAITFVAVDTTGTPLTNILLDLAARPEYITILRQEIQDELKQNRGVWDGALMKSLRKTDSFMKESQRHNPIAWCTFMRKILKPITLKDGTYLPAGSTVLSNTHMVSNDPDINGKDITEFDGLRYYKIWASNETCNAEQAGPNQFVSTSLGSLMFGYGKHACPGRFFAGMEIKVILAKVLVNFDLRLENTTERYKNVTFEDRNFADPTKNIMFKRIQ